LEIIGNEVSGDPGNRGEGERSSDMRGVAKRNLEADAYGKKKGKFADRHKPSSR